MCFIFITYFCDSTLWLFWFIVAYCLYIQHFKHFHVVKCLHCIDYWFWNKNSPFIFIQIAISYWIIKPIHSTRNLPHQAQLPSTCQCPATYFASHVQHIATKDVVSIIAQCSTTNDLSSLLKGFHRFPKEILCFPERNIVFTRLNIYSIPHDFINQTFKRCPYSPSVLDIRKCPRSSDSYHTHRGLEF